MTNEEFEEIFGNVPLENIKKIQKYIQEQIQKKDEQIDLMAEHISKQDIDEDICIKNITNPDWCNEDYTNCKDCIKQYFADKVNSFKKLRRKVKMNITKYKIISKYCTIHNTQRKKLSFLVKRSKVWKMK